MSRDFKDTVDLAIEYAYDANGNMTMNANNGIYSIAYNALNLPKKITFAEPGVSNEYVYSASGVKLSVLHKKASTDVRTDYVGNMIYRNDSLDMILVDGGYIRDGQYHFFLQDHLGSNRVVADANGNIVQANHYYPYGTPFAESYSSDIQKYKYIGKEYDTDNGLDWYDVEARMMDGLRFTTMDPLAEKYYSWSPYVYGLANPIRFYDPDGKSAMGPGGPLARWMPENTSTETYQKAGQFALDYFTPIGDLFGLFTGKTLSNEEYNRAEAGAYAAIGFIPLTKILKGAGSLVKVGLKYSDDVAGLVKTTGKVSEEAKEIITVTKSGNFSDALKVAKDVVGNLGDDATDYVTNTGKGKNPFFGKATGKSSADGKRYWRVDVDPETGQAHINWVNGKQKGSIDFNGGLDQAKRIVDNEIFR